MDHSYEEIRNVALDILAGREECMWINKPGVERYDDLSVCVAEVSRKREQPEMDTEYSRRNRPSLSDADDGILLEVFWDFFRQGIITLGLNSYHPEFPFFRVSGLGEKILEDREGYFFHDISSYEKVIRESIPDIDSVTLIYLKEAMQSFLCGCVLSSTVMIGVAAEHSFLRLLETIEGNPRFKPTYKNVFGERTILQKLNKFRNILDQNTGALSSEVKEDLDTNFTGILSMIRNFRNQSGHPSGKIISREWCFVLLQLFIPCCKKIYQLIDFFKSP